MTNCKIGGLLLRHFPIAFNGTTTTAAVRSHFVCFEKAGNFQLVAKLRPSAACQLILFMVLNLSRFKPNKLW